MGMMLGWENYQWVSADFHLRFCFASISFFVGQLWTEVLAHLMIGDFQHICLYSTGYGNTFNAFFFYLILLYSRWLVIRHLISNPSGPIHSKATSRGRICQHLSNCCYFCTSTISLHLASLKPDMLHMRTTLYACSMWDLPPSPIPSSDCESSVQYVTTCASAIKFVVAAIALIVQVFESRYAQTPSSSHSESAIHDQFSCCIICPPNRCRQHRWLVSIGNGGRDESHTCLHAQAFWH